MITIAISALSLFVSIFVASSSLINSKASIKITQLKENRSWILKSYDGSMAAIKQEDVGKLAPTMESITLVEVIVTNNSSLPISILEFQMCGAIPFNSYSYVMTNLQVTPEHGAKSIISNEDQPLKYIQPEFTLGPYTSKRGYISFWMNDEESIQRGKKDMTIVTSRGKFTKKVAIKGIFESAKKYEPS